MQLQDGVKVKTFDPVEIKNSKRIELRSDNEKGKPIQVIIEKGDGKGAEKPQEIRIERREPRP